jgi:oxygen-independent coproporphyrinogen III oxidase
MTDKAKSTAGLYVHIPFCGRKCLYCDFYSKVPRTGEIEAFLNALGVEARLRNEGEYGPFVYDSVFLGGGTPSLLSAVQIKSLFKHIRSHNQISPSAEITIECNPSSIQIELLKAYKELGINRISLGVQTFNDTHLEMLGRLHDSAEAKASFKEIKLAGFENISIDLIYGLPDQTIEEWRSDLAQTIGLGPTHISAYNLIIEPGTLFGKLYSQGKLELPSEDIQSEMYEALNNDLGVAGFGRYELSNFARPGFECQHNLKYWHLKPYLGLGPSAVSFDGETRIRNEANLDLYLKAAYDKEPPPHEDETLEPEKLREEAIMMGLRLTEGLSCTELRERFGYDILSDKADAIKSLTDNGYLLLEDDHLKLAPKALFISDEVIVRVI